MHIHSAENSSYWVHFEHIYKLCEDIETHVHCCFLHFLLRLCRVTWCKIMKLLKQLFLLHTVGRSQLIKCLDCKKWVGNEIKQLIIELFWSQDLSWGKTWTGFFCVVFIWRNKNVCMCKRCSSVVSGCCTVASQKSLSRRLYCYLHCKVSGVTTAFKYRSKFPKWSLTHT